MVIYLYPCSGQHVCIHEVLHMSAAENVYRGQIRVCVAMQEALDLATGGLEVRNYF